MNFAPASACVLGREAMRDLDARTIAAGTPSLVLMERAGAALAAFLGDASATGIATSTRSGPRRLLVLAGRGNNGGD
jgi:ADP-dependent NAD(P)H-hydrate dehydratase / NAD(P)H-hydrate epimerase